MGIASQILAQGAPAPALNSGDTAWMLAAASLVLLMTPGLAFFYGGMSRQKSVLNMMMMSFGALGVVGVIYVLWGYSMSFSGTDIGGLFGNPFTNFGLDGLLGDADSWSLASSASTIPTSVFIGFQATFAIITVALISGAIAERVKFDTWLVFCVLWATITYFPISHMVWGGGLLSATGKVSKIFEGVAPVDFAGGTVVHMNAGLAGLVLVLIIGKRVGFGKTAFRPHNLPLVMIGTGLLWFGWFGFNAGSALTAGGSAGLAWLNTAVATCAGLLGWLAVERFRDGHSTSLGAASGVVAGLVAITPACGSVNPMGAIAIGAIAGIVSAFAVGLKTRFGFDDSLDVVGVHLVSGLWGTLAVGFFATGKFATAPGIFYSKDGWKLLVVQLIVAAAVLLYTGITTGIIAFALKGMGWRVAEADEKSGIDAAEHAESAYEGSTQSLIS